MFLPIVFRIRCASKNDVVASSCCIVEELTIIHDIESEIIAHRTSSAFFDNFTNESANVVR